jgi:hypothetical protein
MRIDAKSYKEKMKELMSVRNDIDKLGRLTPKMKWKSKHTPLFCKEMMLREETKEIEEAVIYITYDNEDDKNSLIEYFNRLSLTRSTNRLTTFIEGENINAIRKYAKAAFKKEIFENSVDAIEVHFRSYTWHRTSIVKGSEDYVFPRDKNNIEEIIDNIIFHVSDWGVITYRL